MARLSRNVGHSVASLTAQFECEFCQCRPGRAGRGLRIGVTVPSEFRSSDESSRATRWRNRASARKSVCRENGLRM